MISQHAHARILQIGLKEEDLDFIFQNGTEAGDGFFLTTQDVQEIVTQAKRSISLAQRLKNKLAVRRDDVVVTAFPLSPKQQRRRLRL